MTTKTTAGKPKKRRTPTRETRRLLPVMEDLTMTVVGSAKLNGRKLDARLVEAIVGLERDLTISGANILSVQILDPDRELLRADLLGGQLDLDLGIGGRWRLDRSRDIGGLSVAGDLLTLRFWDRASAALRAQTTPRRWSSDRLDIGGWGKALAREIRDDVLIDVLAPYPGDVPDPERTSGGRKTKAAGFSGGTLKGKVDEGAATSTLRPAELRNIARALATAKKQKAPPRATLALICAGLVEGPNWRNSAKVTDGTSVGALQAQAIHGSVKQRMDLEAMCTKFLRPGFWKYGGAIELARKYPTWTAGQIAQRVQGSDFPARYDLQAPHARKIIAAWEGGGSDDRGTTTESRPAQWRRGSSKAHESSWTALERECKRLGRRRFIANTHLQTPSLVIAADQQLIAAQPHQLIDGLDDRVLSAAPSIELEGIARLQTVELTVVLAGWCAPPGGVVQLANCGPADGPWIVSRLIAPAGSDTAQVTLIQPTTKVEKQADKSTGSKGRAASRSAKRGPAAAISWARKRIGIREEGFNRGARVEQIQRAAGGSAGSPWCGYFVIGAMKAGGITGLDARYGRVQNIYDDAGARTRPFSGRSGAASGRPGDLAVIGGSDTHVELVVSVDRTAEVVHTIGGNTGLPRGGEGVAAKSRRFGEITAIAHVVYPS